MFIWACTHRCTWAICLCLLKNTEQKLGSAQKMHDRVIQGLANTLNPGSRQITHSLLFQGQDEKSYSKRDNIKQIHLKDFVSLKLKRSTRHLREMFLPSSLCTMFAANSDRVNDDVVRANVLRLQFQAAIVGTTLTSWIERQGVQNLIKAVIVIIEATNIYIMIILMD